MNTLRVLIVCYGSVTLVHLLDGRRGVGQAGKSSPVYRMLYLLATKLTMFCGDR